MWPHRSDTTSSAARFVAVMLVAGAFLAACGSDGSGNGSDCDPGTFCPCTTSTDCPGGETCDPILLLCVASTSDAGDVGEDTVDAGPDTEDTGGEDTGGEDADTIEPTDTVDTSPDTDEDVDTGPDTQDADTSDAGEDTVEDVADTTDTTPDVGPFLDDNYNPWIVYASGNPFAVELKFILANGTGATTLSNCASVACDTEDDDLSREAPEFSPDGTRVAFLASPAIAPLDYRLGLLDLIDGEITYFTLFPPDDGQPGRASSLSWSPDGTRIVVSGRTQPRGAEDRLSIVELSTGDVTAFTETGDAGQADTSPVWSPDGNVIYFARFDGSSSDILAMNVETGDDEALVTNEAVAGMAVTANGDRLYYVVAPEDSGSDSSLWYYDFAAETENFVSTVGDEGISLFRAGTRYAASRDFGVLENPAIEILLADAADSGNWIRLTVNGFPDRAPSVSRFDGCELTGTVLPTFACPD